MNLFKVFKRKSSNLDITKLNKHALYDNLIPLIAQDKINMDNYEKEFKRQKETIKKANSTPEMALDSDCINNFWSAETYNLNDKLIAKNSFRGFGYLALLVQIPYILNACDKYANELMRKGFKFVSIDPNDDKLELIELLNEKWKKFNCNDILLTASLKTLQLGGCQIYPKIKDDEKLLNKKLIINESTIKPGSLEYFTVIEPIWCVATEINYTKPLEKDYYCPTMYNIMGNSIHASRLISVIFSELPQQIKPLYQFYGKSLTAKMLDSVTKVTEVADDIAEIIKRYNLTVLGVSLNSANENPNKLINRIKNFINCKTNWGVFVHDSKEEKIEQIQMSLVGLDDLLSRFEEMMCIAPQIPATKMLGISPKGFSTNDESGENNFYDNIDSLRIIKLKPIIEQMMHLIMLNEGIEIDHNIAIEFGKLKESTPLEQAQINEINSRRDTNYDTTGILSSEEIRQKLAMDPESGYNSLEIENNDLEDDNA